MSQTVLKHKGKTQSLYQEGAEKRDYFFNRLLAAEKHYQPLPYQITKALYEGEDSLRMLTGVSVDYGTIEDYDILICIEVGQLHPATINGLELHVLIGLDGEQKKSLVQRDFKGKQLTAPRWQIRLVPTDTMPDADTGLQVVLLPHSNQVLFFSKGGTVCKRMERAS